MIKEDLDIDEDNYSETLDINKIWRQNISYAELEKREEKLENGGEWSMFPYLLNERAETYHKSASVLKDNHPLMIMLNEERMVRKIISFQCNIIYLSNYHLSGPTQSSCMHGSYTSQVEHIWQAGICSHISQLPLLHTFPDCLCHRDTCPL